MKISKFNDLNPQLNDMAPTARTTKITGSEMSQASPYIMMLQHIIGGVDIIDLILVSVAPSVTH